MSYPFDRAEHDSIELSKALMRRQFALDHQAKHGGSFSRAWDKVLLDHPELAEGEPLGAPSSMPAYTPPLPGKVAADQVKLDALLKKYMSGSRRVEADKKDDDGELMLVMAADGSIDHLELR